MLIVNCAVLRLFAPQWMENWSNAEVMAVGPAGRCRSVSLDSHADVEEAF